jgi:acetyltransferase
VFRSPEDAVRGLRYLVSAHHARELIPAAESQCQGICDREGAQRVIAQVRAAGRELLNEIEAKSLLAAYGIPVVETHFAATAVAVGRACEGLQPPFAVKIISASATHKSDIGGVALELADSRSAIAAAKKMEKRIAKDHPEVTISGFSVQSMVARRHSHELIAGISNDPAFGPVLVVGAGGKAVELLHDRALDLPPIDGRLAKRMIAGTRISERLAGYRDEPAANRDAIVSVLRALSALAVDLPEVLELDINPLLVDPSGAIALDARIRISRKPRLSRLVIKPLPMEWAADLVTRGGTRIHVRPAEESDAPDLAEFFRNVSEEDHHFRFLSAKKDVTEAQIAAMVCVDPRRTITFIALDETQRLVSAGTLAVDCNGEKSEVAISVREDCKGRGIAWRMLEHILRYASAHSITVVESLESTENRAAIALEREMGFEIAGGDDDRGEVVARKTLRAGPSRERA